MLLAMVAAVVAPAAAAQSPSRAQPTLSRIMLDAVDTGDTGDDDDGHDVDDDDDDDDDDDGEGDVPPRIQGEPSLPTVDPVDHRPADRRDPEDSPARTEMPQVDRANGSDRSLNLWIAGTLAAVLTPLACAVAPWAGFLMPSAVAAAFIAFAPEEVNASLDLRTLFYPTGGLIIGAGVGAGVGVGSALIIVSLLPTVPRSNNTNVTSLNIAIGAVAASVVGGIALGAGVGTMLAVHTAEPDSGFGLTPNDR